MKLIVLRRCALAVFMALSHFITANGVVADLPSGRVAYLNGFEDRVGEEWSKTDVSTTPIGERKFLGNFGPEKVSFSLTELPKHRFVRVEFDLFLIQSWDGSSRNWGPDIWEMSVESGPRLIHATFTNCGYYRDNNVQSFPDDHQSTTHKGWTGASEKQSLGYKWFLTHNNGKGYVTDGVYKINVIFPHNEASLKLNFKSHCEDTKEDQSWGLDNVKVETIASAARLTDEAMNQCWTSLAGEDPVTAFKSIWQMVASGEQAVSFLERKLRIPPVKNFKELKTLLSKLDDDAFQTRERATKQLIQLGRGIEPILRKALEDATSNEVRFRLNAILKQFKTESTNPAEVLRHQRAARVLEVIGSEKARELKTLIKSTIVAPDPPDEITRSS